MKQKPTVGKWRVMGVAERNAWWAIMHASGCSTYACLECGWPKSGCNVRSCGACRPDPARNAAELQDEAATKHLDENLRKVFG